MRAGFSLRLKPEGLAEYKRRHDEIWPELVDELARNGTQQSVPFAK
jgi:L-rhamnose mutarotase